MLYVVVSFSKKKKINKNKNNNNQCSFPAKEKNTHNGTTNIFKKYINLFKK